MNREAIHDGTRTHQAVASLLQKRISDQTTEREPQKNNLKAGFQIAHEPGWNGEDSSDENGRPKQAPDDEDRRPRRDSIGSGYDADRRSNYENRDRQPARPRRCATGGEAWGKASKHSRIGLLVMRSAAHALDSPAIILKSKTHQEMADLLGRGISPPPTHTGSFVSSDTNGSTGFRSET